MKTITMIAAVMLAVVGTAGAHGAHTNTGAPHLVEHLVLLAVPAVIAGALILLNYQRRKVRRNDF